MVQSTHDLTIGESEVVKRYRFWKRGEPDREWGGPSLLYQLAPRLAPEPLRKRTDDGIPVIVMSTVPGESLGSSPLTPAQVAAVGEMHDMHTAVPAQHLTGHAERRLGRRSRGHGAEGPLAEHVFSIRVLKSNPIGQRAFFP